MNIFLAPVKFSNTSLLEKIRKELLKSFYSKIDLLDLQIDITNAFYSERSQYFATQVIADALKVTEDQSGKILILTEVDLFIPVLTFIFGEAQLNGKLSIVSVCRLHEEFYSGRTDDELLFDRTIKEILHELGHNFGLKHCENWDCVMHSSSAIEEVDIKGNGYCKSCATVIEDYKFK